jgi:lysophospholipase L1-like esterase
MNEVGINFRGLFVNPRAIIVALTLVAGMIVVLPHSAEAKSSPTYYVSLGDSYSVGYQPGLGSTPGYTVPVAKNTKMTLKNFGCGGATTDSILNTIGCPSAMAHIAGAVAYPTTTQIAAADAFIAKNKGHIGLITVSIAGNDVTTCVKDPDPIACVGTATSNVKKNVTTLANDLRAAAGSTTPIIGLTYPDVILGLYVYPTQPTTPARMSLAQLSVVAFQSLINPALSESYAQAGGLFVDMTTATGAYTPLTNTVNVKKYGEIPAPVASVCALTWFCSKGDIHAKTAGYNLEARLIVSKFKSIKK